MDLKHSSNVRVPDTRGIQDEATRKAVDSLVQLVHDSFKNIFDDLSSLTEHLRHTVDSATTLTLTRGGVYVFTGGVATTWTLPDADAEEGMFFYIKNRGSATITLQRAGTDELYTTTNVTSISITAGQKALITSDGTYWLVHYHA
jgi:hypothetical protein